ncbi:hypothetical protein BT96DRAFT_990816 [Gymnopus androsaceus JB14]|uniref:Ribonuclease H1 N-terminal domain-containing protein n=1 Tax=Gymnopus androsaceus JB14 TaxID=1447944 RepID=A0A6A4I1Y1_9AGAR|nr:hypothetical protein BT96DRAFT_990816 [Gymnopus androsaceus JB14]
MSHRCRFQARIEYSDDTEAEITIERHNDVITTTSVFRLPATPSRYTPVSSTTQRSSRNTTAGSSSATTPSVSLSPPSTPSSPSTPSLAAPTYPAGIPHPDGIVQPIRSSRNYYVVFAGSRVGIFGDWWSEARPYTEGLSSSHQRLFSRFDYALAAYRASYDRVPGSPPLALILPPGQTAASNDLEDRMSQLGVR